MRVLLAACGLLMMCSTHAADKFSFGRFGQTNVYKPKAVQHVVMYFSDVSGWSPADTQFAQALADHGVLVAGIDTQHYAAELAAKPRDKCSYLAGEFEDFSHELQKRYSQERYHMPVLAGSRYGAQLIYGEAAQGSSATFLGIATMNFSPTWKPPLKLCQSYELRFKSTADGMATLQPSSQLSTRWIELHSQEDKHYSAAAIKQFVDTVGTAKLSLLTKTAEKDATTQSLWQQALINAVDSLAQADQPPRIVADELSDLVIDEVRASKPSASMALILTGDGGWAEIDRGIASELSKQGIDVVALSSLQYFWKPRSPDESAKDVARILRHYLAAWQKRDVLIVGYSFGADIAPFVVNRLPQDLRQRIASIGLLGLEATADFEIHVTTWLGVEHHGLQTRPEVERLHEKVLCVFGEGEKDSLCPSLHASNIVSMQIGDGHHFGNDYRKLAEQIILRANASSNSSN